MNHTLPATESNLIETSRVSPFLLIFMAWLSGTLMFELSALDDIGSLAASQHSSNPSNALEMETPMINIQTTSNSIDQSDRSVASDAR